MGDGSEIVCRSTSGVEQSRRSTTSGAAQEGVGDGSDVRRSTSGVELSRRSTPRAAPSSSRNLAPESVASTTLGKCKLVALCIFKLWRLIRHQAQYCYHHVSQNDAEWLESSNFAHRCPLARHFENAKIIS
jgi:hypothetical protein